MPTRPRGADCFGPGSGGSGQGVPVQGANALGIDRRGGEEPQPRCNPLLLLRRVRARRLRPWRLRHRRATPPGFCLLVHEGEPHRAAGRRLDSSGSSAGDQVLWYLTPPNFTAAERARARCACPRAPGDPVSGAGRSPTATTGPPRRPRARSFPAARRRSPPTRPATRQVTLRPRRRTDSATRGDNDDPEPGADRLLRGEIGDCPPARGRIIVGSRGSDVIAGTAGDDRIKPRAGNDGVRALAGDDRVDVRGGGKDRVNCGGGDDSVKVDKRDKLAKSCEHRSRSAKKKQASTRGEGQEVRSARRLGGRPGALRRGGRRLRARPR